MKNSWPVAGAVGTVMQGIGVGSGEIVVVVELVVVVEVVVVVVGTMAGPSTR